MVSLADAYIRIRPDTTEMTPSAISKPSAALGKAAGEEAGRSFGSAFSGLLKTVSVAAAGIASGEIVKFFHETITQASDLREEQSKLSVVFGKSSASVAAFGKNADQSMGLSQVAYTGATATLGNLLVSLKLPVPAAADMSEKMVKLAGDMASFNNASPADALQAIQAGLVGQVEPLRRYGVSMLDASLRQEAVKLGLEKTTKEVLPPAIRAQAAYALIMDQSKTAQGDFQRTSSGLANQQRILAAQFDDVKARIGSALLPAFTGLVTFITQKFMPGFNQFISGLQGKGPIDGFVGNLNTAGLALRGLFEAFKSGDVTSDGLVGTFERIGVAARSIANDLLAFGKFFVDNKDAVVAFVATLATLKLGIEAVALATKAWAAVQALIAFVQLAAGVRSVADAMALLDLAMDANPIGLVVIAIAALVAGLVLAWQHSETFRSIVLGAFEGVKVAALFLWHNVFDPLWQGIVAAFNGIVSGAQSFWQGTVAVFNGVVGAAQAFWQGLKTAFDAVVAALNVLAQPFLFLWHNVVQPVFDGILVVVNAFYVAFKTIILIVVDVIVITLGAALKGLQALWSLIWDGIKAVTTTVVNALKAVWQLLVDYLGGPLTTANNAIHTLFTNVWNAISSFISGIANTIKGWWQGLVNFLDGPLTTAHNALHTIITNVWNGISNVISTVWNFIRDSVFTPLSGFITKTIPDAFQSGVAAVGRFWDGLKDIVKTPINAVINFINGGIINPIDKLVGVFGGVHIDAIPQLHTGGVIPGNVLNDGIMGFSAGGMPTARVESGEFIVNRRQTRKHLAVLQAINSGVEGFAGGGIVGAVTGGLSDVIGIITDPIGSLTNGIEGLVNSVANNQFTQMLVNVPRKIIEWAADWIKTKFSGLLGGGGPAALGGPGGDSVGAILTWARAFDPTATVSSGYRPGAADYHGQGLAADIIGSNMDAIAAGFYSMSNRLIELIHSPSWFVKNGQRVGGDYYASVLAEHYNHVHVAAYANALGFASGGVINEPIWGVGASGRRYTFGERGPETVIPGVGGSLSGGGGVNFTVNVQGDVSDAHVQEIKRHVNDAFSKFYVQLKTGRRR